MEGKPDCTLVVGKEETKFYKLAREQFPPEGFPLETRLEGDIVLELEHMDSPNKGWREPEYFVNLQMGRYFGTCLGRFKNKDSARTRYEQCRNALQNGGRISLGVTNPQILDSDGNLVCKETYRNEAEDC